MTKRLGRAVFGRGQPTRGALVYLGHLLLINLERIFVAQFLVRLAHRVDEGVRSLAVLRETQSGLHPGAILVQLVFSHGYNSHEVLHAHEAAALHDLECAHKRLGVLRAEQHRELEQEAK